MKKTFFTRLFLTFLVVGLIPVVLLGYVAMTASNASSINTVRRQVSSAAINGGHTMGKLIRLFEDGLRLFSVDPEVRELFVSNSHEARKDANMEVFRKMYLLLSGYSEPCAMHVVSRDGSVQISTTVFPPQYDPRYFSDWGIFRLLAGSSEPVMLSSWIMDVDGYVPALSVGMSIFDDDGDVAGYAIIDIPASSLIKHLHSTVETLPFHYAVIDASGFLLLDEMGMRGDAPFVSPEWRSRFLRDDQPPMETMIGESRMLLAPVSLTNDSLFLIASVPVDLVYVSTRKIVFYSILFAGISIVLSVAFAYGFARSLSRPIMEISAVMGDVEQGKLDTRCLRTRNDELGVLSSRMNTMVDNLERLFKENQEKQQLLRTAELRNLMAQIDPHFLYNTLDCIRYMIRLGMTTEANHAISNLGILLKNGIDTSIDMNTVSDAVRIIESYLDIVRLSYPDKFSITLDIAPEILDCMIPKLIIQPIVENAIVHGLEPKIGIGKLEVVGIEEHGRLLFIVRDDGVGMDNEMLVRLLASDDARFCVGLRNIRRRLKLYYGDEMEFSIRTAPGSGTEVRLGMPERKEPCIE